MTDVKTLRDARRTGDNCHVVLRSSLDNCHDTRNLWRVYRASTNPPITAWARHLDQVMRAKDWSRVRLFEEVGAELGYKPKSRTAFLKFLEDREPNATQAAIFRKHFGDPTADLAPAPTGATDTPDPLIAALTAQTAAIERLVALLEGDLPARVAALEPVVSRLAERVLAGQPELPLPHETAG